MTTVVNIKKGNYDVYCGRGSIFGNPYEIPRDGDRDTVIAKYEKWFNHLIGDPVFKHALHKLKDKRLGCFCAPFPCHCDVIKNYLDNLPS